MSNLTWPTTAETLRATLKRLLSQLAPVPEHQSLPILHQLTPPLLLLDPHRPPPALVWLPRPLELLAQPLARLLAHLLAAHPPLIPLQARMVTIVKA